MKDKNSDLDRSVRKDMGTYDLMKKMALNKVERWNKIYVTDLK